jgi:hypothetical protein
MHCFCLLLIRNKVGERKAAGCFCFKPSADIGPAIAMIQPMSAEYWCATWATTHENNA